MSSTDQEEYILILERDDAEKLDYAVMPTLKKLFLEFNIDKDQYEPTTTQFAEKCQNFAQIESLNFLLEGCKAISLNSYKNIGKILEKANLCKILILEIQFENAFNSAAASIISLSLETFKHLTELSLIIRAENQLSKQGIINLADSISKLTHLNKLKFLLEDGNTCGEEGATSLGECIKKLSDLTLLNLEMGDSVQLGQQGSSALCNSIYSLTKLETLRFAIGYKNEFGNGGMQSMSKGLSGLVLLKKLVIKIGRENQITQEGFKNFAEGFQSLQELKEFAFQIDEWNEWGLIGGEEVAKGISACKGLVKLNFKIGHFSKLTEEGGMKLSQIISSLSNLEELKFIIGAENNFGNNSLIEVSKHLSSLHKLRSLHLQFESSNKIGDSGFTEFAQNISHLENLKTLIVRVDEFNDVTASGVCKAIFHLSKLQSVEQYQLKCTKILKFERVSSKKRIQFEISQKISQQDTVDFFEGLSNYQQLETIRSNLLDQFEINSEFINSFKKFLVNQKQLLNFKFVSQNQGDYQAADLIELFSNSITSDEVEKSLVLVNDQIRCSIEPYQSKKGQYKIQFIIMPYVGANLKCYQEMAKIINSKQLKMRHIQIQIQQENNLDKECGQLLCEAIIKCPCATELSMELNEQNPQISQSLKQMQTLLQKIVSDRSRNLKTYYRIFAKVMQKYKNKIDYNIITNVGQYLPLMKDFNVQQGFQGQGQVFGLYNQAAVNLQQQFPQDEVENNEFESDSDY